MGDKNSLAIRNNCLLGPRAQSLEPIYVIRRTCHGENEQIDPVVGDQNSAIGESRSPALLKPIIR